VQLRVEVALRVLCFVHFFRFFTSILFASRYGCFIAMVRFMDIRLVTRGL